MASYTEQTPVRIPPNFQHQSYSGPSQTLDAPPHLNPGRQAWSQPSTPYLNDPYQNQNQSGQLVPAPPQQQYQQQTRPQPSSGALHPSAANQMQPYDDGRASYESAHSHRSGRPRSSSHQSHRSHHSTHSKHDHHEERRPTLGDTVMLIWDSFWGAWSPRRK